MTDDRAARPVPTGGLRLGSVLGFEIRLDLSWFVIFVLVFWSLSAAVFPSELPEASRPTLLAMGLSGTLLFFASLLAHELSHGLVSRSKGIPVEGITLFLFGGMAWTRSEPNSPKDELLIAGAGPLASLFLAGAFHAAANVVESAGLGAPVWGVARYLAFINLVLAIFNLAPGFPLDGGRIFRAIVWHVTGDRTRATRWAVTGGRLFGLALIVLGVVETLGGALIGGLWLVFIGWFLRGLAGSSLQQQALQDLLRGFVTSDLMSPDPETVPATLGVSSLVHDHFMRLRFASYPVIENGALVGMVTLEEVKGIASDKWEAVTVRDAMIPLDQCAIVSGRTTVEAALREMSRPATRGRALVVDNGRLVGIVSASDVTRWVQRLQAMGDLVRA